MTIIPYEAPEPPVLLVVSSFIYLINVADTLFAYLINAGIVGPLIIGIVYGPQAADILSEPFQKSFITLGYLGLLLIVFEAGLSTNITLLFNNILLSVVVALTGVILPIALSLLLLHFAYGYPVIQAFAAGAALCSTSLGTTLALLRPELKQTMVGTVLMSAALLDDIAGLVIAAIIPNLSTTESSESTTISWQIIVRPILVSLAFAFGTPALAYAAQALLQKIPSTWSGQLSTGRCQLFLIVAILSGFVAGAKYAGTSELFGAYLAGAFLAHVYKPSFSVETNSSHIDEASVPLSSIRKTFARYILQLLENFLSPIFFASIGTALPIRSLVSINGSHRVIWRGLVYSLLMVLAKAMVGFWMLVWPGPQSGHGWCGTRRKTQKKQVGNSDLAIIDNHEHVSPIGNSLTTTPPTLGTELPRVQSAMFLGLAMVARGEIALIVAQLARPILVDNPSDASATSEPFAVVTWAILVTTVGGAVGVGCLLRQW